MKFKTILENIQNEGQIATQRIEIDAKRQIEEINRATEESAEKQRSRILADGRARLSRETALIEQQASVKSLQIHADARQELIDAVLEEIQNNFSLIRSRDDYSSILGLMVEEVINTLTPSILNGQRILLHFDSRDKKLAEKIIKGIRPEVELMFDLDTAGGCFGETDDGLVASYNTIESRFKRAGAMLQQKLSLFFEDKVSSA